MKNLRVLVVDDTTLYRILVQDALGEIPEVTVVGTAKNGKEALEKIQDLQPQLVILDVEMPEMTGIELLRELKDRGQKLGVIMLSSFTTRGGDLTIQALELGAFDFVTKPDGGSAHENKVRLKESLLPLVRAYGSKREQTPDLPVVPPPRHPQIVTKPQAVAIGVSTGGPHALGELLGKLKAPPPVPIFIVQHMPPLFTASLAASLSARCGFPVREAAHEEAVEPGIVYLAPGGKQMKLVNGGAEVRIAVTNDPPENNCRPSVDYLFRSVSQVYKDRAVGVIMTGMGNDGTMGLRLMKRMGAWVIAQDESSCVVYSMPREAVKAGVVDQILPLGSLAAGLEETWRR